MLRSADAVAEISASAGLRQLAVAGRELLVGPAAGEPNPGYHGELLAPWPNRIGRARYHFRGVEYQLTPNEQPFGHAIHGFARDLQWHTADRDRASLTLFADLDEQPGYPFRLRFEVEYRLDDEGVNARFSTLNTGAVPAPVGLGSHPYLRAGESPLDSWELSVPSHSFLDVDESTLLPTHLRSVDQTPFDFRVTRAISSQTFSRAYLLAGDNAVIKVRDPDGSGVQLSIGDAGRWVQIYTGDVADPRLHRRGLAVEPMTCAPNAFASGNDFDVLAPGERLVLSWRISTL